MSDAAKVVPQPGKDRLSIAVMTAMCAAFAFIAWPMRWYNDDTFITFRYSKHLAEGHGFVWNTVDPVRIEGSSSLGWTVLNAMAMTFGLAPTTFSWIAGTIAGMAGLIAVYLGGRHLLQLSRFGALLAPALLVAHRQWVAWSVSGFETVTATVLAFIATLYMAREHGRASDLAMHLDSDLPRTGPKLWMANGLLFFAATLFRPEMPLLHLAAGVGLALAAREGRQMAAIVVSGGTHFLALLGLIGWRMIYFGHPLPNTFYAKVGAIQADIGLPYIGQFLIQTHAWLWGALIVIAAGWWLRQRVALPMALAAQCIAWSGWIVLEGGGIWEFRFMVMLLPAIALLTTVSLARVAHMLPQPARLPVIVAGALMLLLTQSTALAPVHKITGLESFAPFRQFGDTASIPIVHRSAEILLDEGRTLSPYLSEDDRVCIGWAGAFPYITDVHHFDPWGLNDLEIARRPFNPDGMLYHQRHATWQDVIDRDVWFSDLYNQFLYTKPYPPDSVPRPLQPWVKPGVMVYCVEIPVRDDMPRPRYRYWIFASPQPREKIVDWLDERGLELTYSLPLTRDPVAEGQPQER